MNESYDQMTLHDRLVLAERTLREFTDHLERGFLPQVGKLIELVQPGHTGSYPASVKDITVRNTVGDVLKSDEYTNELLEKLTALCESLKKEVENILAAE